MTTANEAADAILTAMSTPPTTGNIKWDCRADGCYRDSLPDWTPLNDCFPRGGIRLSDVDGMVEVGNHFLFIEWKLPNVAVPEGQHKALVRLTKLPGITVLVVWGRTTRTPENWQVIHNGTPAEPAPVSYDQLHQFVTSWATSADAQPQPRPGASQPRPDPPGRTEVNRVPQPRPRPFRDAGDAGRATPQTTPPTNPSGTRLGTHPGHPDEGAA